VAGTVGQQRLHHHHEWGAGLKSPLPGLFTAQTEAIVKSARPASLADPAPLLRVPFITFALRRGCISQRELCVELVQVGIECAVQL